MGGGVPRHKVGRVPGKRDEPEATEQATGRITGAWKPKGWRLRDCKSHPPSRPDSCSQDSQITCCTIFPFLSKGGQKGKNNLSSPELPKMPSQPSHSTRQEVGAGHLGARENSLLKLT